MTDIETRTDRNIESIAYHYDNANRDLWICAYQAHKVYGLYEEYATRNIAERTHRSLSSVKNWVNAYRCFVSCLALEYRPTILLRRELSLTHFRVMYELAQKYGLSTEKQRYFFGVMLGYKQTGEIASVEALRREVEAVCKDSDPIDWQWHFKRLTGGSLDALASFNGHSPADVHAWTMEGRRLREKYSNG